MGKKKRITKYSLTKSDPTKTRRRNLAVISVASWGTTRSSVTRGYVPNVKEQVMMSMFAPHSKRIQVSQAGLNIIDDYMMVKSRETSRGAAVGNT